MRHWSRFEWRVLTAFAGMVSAISATSRPALAEEVRLLVDWAPNALLWHIQPPYFDIRPNQATKIDGKMTLFGFQCMATKESPRSPLPNAYTHRYAMGTPWLHDGDLLPMLGHLYCVEPIQLIRGRPPCNSARRLPAEEVPAGIQMRYDTYIFPLMDQTRDETFMSGGLHERLLYVWAFERPKDAKASLRAKVGTFIDNKEWPRHRVEDIVWKWYREGDWVEIGEYRHKLLKIVPPREPEELKRGTARMVGWIELDRHAEPNPTAKANEKEKKPSP